MPDEDTKLFAGSSLKLLVIKFPELKFTIGFVEEQAWLEIQ